MTRVRLAALILAAWPLYPQTAPPPANPAVQEPPEEDISSDRPKEYVFNPLQAAKEIRIGNYYFKKRSYKAAAGRFREALKWDPNDAEAWLRLGDTQEKLHKIKEAHQAWTKYLEIKPDGKEAEALKKKLASKS